jgi:hypothetical protein
MRSRHDLYLIAIYPINFRRIGLFGWIVVLNYCSVFSDVDLCCLKIVSSIEAILWKSNAPGAGRRQTTLAPEHAGEVAKHST